MLFENFEMGNNIALRGSSVYISYENYMMNVFKFKDVSIIDNDAVEESYFELQTDSQDETTHVFYIETVSNTTIEFDNVTISQPSLLSISEEKQTISQPVMRFFFASTQNGLTIKFKKLNAFMNFVNKSPVEELKSLWARYNKTFPVDENFEEEHREITSMFFFNSESEELSQVTFSDCNFQTLYNLVNLNQSSKIPMFFFNKTSLSIKNSQFSRILAFSDLLKAYKSKVAIINSQGNQIFSKRILNAEENQFISIEGLNLTQSIAYNSSFYIQKTSKSPKMIGEGVRDSYFSSNVGIEGGVFFIRGPGTQRNRRYHLEMEENDALQTKKGNGNRHQRFKDYSDGMGVLVFENNTFYKNIGRKGGAIYVDEKITVKFEHCNFRGNNALWGGAIFSLMSRLKLDNSNNLTNTVYFSIKDHIGNFKFILGVFHDQTMTYNNESTTFKLIKNLPTYICIELLPIMKSNIIGYIGNPDPISKLQNDFNNFQRPRCSFYNDDFIYIDPYDDVSEIKFNDELHFHFYPGIGFANESSLIGMFSLNPTSQGSTIEQIPLSLFQTAKVILRCYNSSTFKVLGERQLILNQDENFDSLNSVPIKIISPFLNDYETYKDQNGENFSFGKFISSSFLTNKSEPTQFIWELEIVGTFDSQEISSRFPIIIEGSYCPDGYAVFPVGSEQNKQCLRCRQSQFSLKKLTDNKCFQCIEGAICQNGFMVVQKGYWRTDYKSFTVIKCDNPEDCAEELNTSFTLDESSYNNIEKFSFGTLFF